MKWKLLAASVSQGPVWGLPSFIWFLERGGESSGGLGGRPSAEAGWLCALGCRELSLLPVLPRTDLTASTRTDVKNKG